MPPAPGLPVQSAPAAQVTDLYFARQPILDRQRRLWGYELLFRTAGADVARVSDDAHASATVITHAFMEFSVGDALGPYVGFINIDAELLMSDALELLPARSVVLELLETLQVTPEVVRRVARLRSAGYRFALDDVVRLEGDSEALLPYVEIVKVDLKALPPDEWAPMCERIHARRLLALAEKVDDEAEAQRCFDAGYDLYQGYYFARPALVSGRRLDPSQLSLMRLMRLILTDAGTADIEAVFKEEPGLSLNLLRLTNSAAAGLPVRVTSLRHAITFLGRRQLQRWMQLLMFAARDGHGGGGALLQLAATRGRMMELLAAECRPSDGAFSDQALMCGILSLTPALLQLPIDEIVGGLGLEPALQEALVRNEGALGALLQLCIALEAPPEGGADDVRKAASRAGLDTLTGAGLNALQSQALAWANRLGVQAS